MKILYKSTLNFLILFFILFTAFAQSNFEGKIVYTITYEDMPAEMKGMESMLPKEMKMHIKENKSRIEQNQMMGKMIVVSDMDQKNGFMEMAMGGQQIRINISTAEFEQETNKLPKVEYLDDIKDIAGYACKKAIMSDENGQLTMTVYYTDKINNKAQKEFAGLNGFPLQYSMIQQGMKVIMTASEVSEESVPESTFDKSEGYQDMSQSDFQKMMGGGF